MTIALPIVPRSYLALIRQFPLHPIRSQREYDLASAVLDKLVMRDEADLDRGERDYLETLEMLIEAYDNQNFVIGPDRRTPLQRLKHRMEQVGMTAAELRKVLDVSQPLVSLILNGKRQLSKANIRRLANHFRVDASYFL
jgi:HTH-type transcriptional regulator/antitoxin HigA